MMLDRMGGAMGENHTQDEKLEHGTLVSLISCLRNEAILYTQLFWGAFLMQLGLTGILLISMGLLFRFFGYFSMSMIGLVGAICSLLLYRAGSILDLHIEMFNESCNKLESDLPEGHQSYAVMQTFSNKVKPELHWYQPKKIFLFSTLFLFLFWLATLIWSGYEVYRNHYQSEGMRYQEVLPFPKR
jgi:hypothetical protein